MRDVSMSNDNKPNENNNNNDLECIEEVEEEGEEGEVLEQQRNNNDENEIELLDDDTDIDTKLVSPVRNQNHADEDSNRGRKRERFFSDNRRQSRSRSRRRRQQERGTISDWNPSGKDLILIDDEEDENKLAFKRSQCRRMLQRKLAAVKRARMRAEQEEDAIKRLLRDVESNDGMVLALHNTRSSEIDLTPQYNRRTRSYQAPLHLSRGVRNDDRWQMGQMVPYMGTGTIAGTWSIKYKNQFRVEYTISSNMRDLILPIQPPKNDPKRRMIYGDTIHGWHGRAVVTKDGGRFLFHPRNYIPKSSRNHPDDSTVWEAVRYDAREDKLLIEFYQGTKHITSGEGTRIAA
mmetsp:Transcript_26871/g.47550  ORF Transcript_26871/g.47550 Transcript_26871/m.47550 type:complete len:348 (+) Transcript_26871:175-1218(+)